jgi:hypothetical protein
MIAAQSSFIRLQKAPSPTGEAATMLKVRRPILLTFKGANPHLLRFGIEQRVHFVQN